MSWFEALRNLDRRDLGAWPPAARHFFSVLLFAAVASLGWTLLLHGGREASEALIRQQARLKQAYRQKHADVLARTALRERLLAVQEAQRRQLACLPRREDLPALLVALAQAAAAAGLQVRRFRPGVERLADGYAEQVLELSMRGSFGQFAQFMRAAASLPQPAILDWEDVSLSAQADGALLLQGRFAIHRRLERGEAAGAQG